LNKKRSFAPMRIFSLLIFLQISSLVFGQKDTVFDLKSIEITATRLPYFAVGQQIMVLDSAALAAFQSRNLADLFIENTPLDLRFYGNTLATTSTRGGGSAHTAVIWNGINLQNSLTGGVDLSNVSMSGVGSAGFKTGGESALFGGGAMSGVLFFDHEIAQKNGFHGQFSVNSGSFGDFRQRAQLSAGNGRFASQINCSHQKADNNFTFRNTAAIGRPFQKQINSAIETSNLVQNFFVKIKEKTILKTTFWAQKTERQIAPTIVAANNFARQNETNFRGVAEIFHQLSRGEWHTRAAVTDEFLIYKSENVANSRNRAQNRILETRFERYFFKKMTNVLGLNFTQNIARSNNFENEKIRNRIALFTSQVIDFQQVKVSLNVRQEFVNNRKIPITFSAGFEKKANRFVGFSEKKRDLLLRGSMARNYNLPAMNDLYWASLGNPNLKPETGFSGEIGFDFLKKKQNSTDFSTGFHATFYAMNLKNRIQWSPGNDAIWRPSNLFNSKSRGIETAFSVEKKCGKWTFKTRESYQFTRATNAKRFQLIYVPKHTGNATFSAQISQFRLDFRQVFGGSRFMSADNLIQTEPFTTSNLTLFWTKKIHQNALSLQISAQNLFNADYQVIRFYAMPRRHFLAQLNFHF
jgi:vitamin B12 transporter